MGTEKEKKREPQKRTKGDAARDKIISIAEDVNLKKFRLALIGALSWSLYWYREDQDSPEIIAKDIVAMLRQGVDKHT